MIRLHKKSCPILLGLLLCTALPSSSSAAPAETDSLSTAVIEQRPPWERYPSRAVGTEAKTGLVVGAAAGGGLLGAWLGSLIAKDPKDGLPRGTRPLRSVALTGGYANFTDRDDATGGFQGRAALYSHFEPWLAVGAEYGLLTGSPHCWRLAAGVRIDPFPMTQTLRPYLAGSIGGNF